MLFRSLAIAIFTALLPATRAAEPFLKKGDVIALVGGEDMVAASEYGYLELCLNAALPYHRLKFRNLAWEGDTVFEQPRQLNFPSWEEQLDKIGATVVICQFGQMESLSMNKDVQRDRDVFTARMQIFSRAYQKLIVRLTADGKRRLVLVESVAATATTPSLDAGAPVMYGVGPALPDDAMTRMPADRKSVV